MNESETLKMSAANLCFIIGFICNLSVARNDSWIS